MRPSNQKSGQKSQESESFIKKYIHRIKRSGLSAEQKKLRNSVGQSIKQGQVTQKLNFNQLNRTPPPRRNTDIDEQRSKSNPKKHGLSKLNLEECSKTPERLTIKYTQENIEEDAFQQLQDQVTIKAAEKVQKLETTKQQLKQMLEDAQNFIMSTSNIENIEAFNEVCDFFGVEEGTIAKKILTIKNIAKQYQFTDEDIQQTTQLISQQLLRITQCLSLLIENKIVLRNGCSLQTFIEDFEQRPLNQVQKKSSLYQLQTHVNAILEKFKKIKILKESSVHSLQEENQSLQKRVKDLVQRNQLLLIEADKSSKLSLEYKNDLEQLREDFGNVQKALQKLNGQKDLLVSLKEQNLQLQKQKDTFEQDYRRIVEKLNQMKLEVQNHSISQQQEVQRILKVNSENQSSLEQLIKNLKVESNNYKMRTDEINQENNFLKSLNNEQLIQIQSMKEQLANQNDDNKENINFQQMEKSQIIILEQQKENLNFQLIQCQQKLEDLKQINEKLQEQLDQYELNFYGENLTQQQNIQIDQSDLNINLPNDLTEDNSFIIKQYETKIISLEEKIENLNQQLLNSTQKDEEKVKILEEDKIKMIFQFETLNQKYSELLLEKKSCCDEKNHLLEQMKNQEQVFESIKNQEILDLTQQYNILSQQNQSDKHHLEQQLLQLTKQLEEQQKQFNDSLSIKQHQLIEENQSQILENMGLQLQIKPLEENLESQTEEINNLKLIAQKKSQDFDTLESQFQKLQGQLVLEQNQIKILQEKLAEVQQKNQQMSQLIQDYENKNSEESDLIEILQKQLFELEEQLKEKTIPSDQQQDEIQELRQKNLTQEEQIFQLKEINQAISTKSEQLDQKLITQNTKILQLEEVIQESENQTKLNLLQHEQEISSYKQIIEEIKVELFQKNEKSELMLQEIDELYSKINDKTLKVEELTSELDQKSQELQQIKTGKLEVDEELSKLQQQFSEFTTQSEELYNQLVESQQSEQKEIINQLENKIFLLNQENDEKQQKLLQIEQAHAVLKMQNLEKQNSSLETNIEKSTQEIILNSTVDLQNDNLLDQGQEKIDAQKEIVFLKNEIQQSSIDKKQLSEEFHQLQQMIQCYKKDIEDAKQQINILEQNIDEAKAETFKICEENKNKQSYFQNEIQQLNEKLYDKDRQTKQLEEIIENLKEQSTYQSLINNQKENTQSQQLKTLKQDLEQIQEQKEQLENYIEQYQQENESLEEKIKSLEETMIQREATIKQLETQLQTLSNNSNQE